MTSIDRVPTAPLAAAGLIAGFGVAVGTGSRPLGGVVMAAFGLTCIAVWLHRDGRRVAVRLTVVGLLAFAISHLLGLVIGAWPSVFVVSALTAAICWRLSDSQRPAA
jgi:tetrahydromethanopterin S-methyltransferase subunit C